jgi:hypothetical protein
VTASQSNAQSITYNDPLSSYIGSFGSDHSGSTETYGVTFYAPGSSQESLNNFTFDWKGTGTVDYQADVFAWNGTQATGSALFSQNTSMTGNGNLQAVTTQTGGVVLNSGQEYVAFFTTSDPTSIANQGNNPDGGWQFGLSSSNLPNNEGGSFVFYNNLTQGLLTTTQWSYIGNASRSAAFTANFTTATAPATPAPPLSACLAFAGVIVLQAYRRHRQSA